MTISQSIPDPEPDPAQTFKARQVWFYALTRPNSANYRDLHRDPLNSKNRGYAYVLSSMAIATILALIVPALFTDSDFLSLGGINVVSLFIGLILVFAMVIILFALAVAITNLAARLLGGKGGFGEMVYLSAAWYAPIFVLNSIFVLFNTLSSLLMGGFGSCLVLPVTFGILAYGVYLEVIAVKTVHGLSWGSSIVAILPVIVLVFGLSLGSLIIVSLSA